MSVNFSSDFQQEFSAIATSFLTCGATCVRLCENDTQIAIFPEDANIAEPFLIANTSAGLTLNISGLTGEPWQSMADTFIELLANLTTAESEMENVTAALVETQDRLVALYETSNATRRILEIPNLLDLLAKMSSNLINTKGAFAYFTQDGKAPIISQWNSFLDNKTIHKLFLKYRDTAQNHIIMNSDTLTDDLQNLVMVNIPIRDDIHACLGLYNKAIEFDTPDIKLANAMAQQIGVQIENILHIEDTMANVRLETELNLARNVQMTLLPQTLPEGKDYDLYAISIPALQVGGDFFDLFSSEKYPLVFILGDVTGKGMSAALLMTMIHTTARSAINNMPFSEPHQIMKRLNTDLFDDFSKLGMFSTAFLGIIERSTCRLLYCNAGQNPIFYIRANQEPLLLEADDIPISIFDGYSYITKDIALSDGDILVVATDGFPEARNINGEMFGYDRLKSILSKNRNLSSKEITEKIIDEVRTFSDGHLQDDDLTIITIKVLSKCKS